MRLAIERRNFIKTASTVVVAAESGEWRNRQPGMRYRRLGRTGCMVSEIVPGGLQACPGGPNRRACWRDRAGWTLRDTR